MNNRCGLQAAVWSVWTKTHGQKDPKCTVCECPNALAPGNCLHTSLILNYVTLVLRDRNSPLSMYSYSNLTESISESSLCYCLCQQLLSQKCDRGRATLLSDYNTAKQAMGWQLNSLTHGQTVGVLYILDCFTTITSLFNLFILFIYYGTYC